ncbi:hypothetical protein LP420_08455 [Massilia sp. B-10]|nr:hypothetical protein LP420_08455 [Massilia sp. B-10]
MNKKSVNWDGYNSIASQNDKILQCARLLLHRQQLVLCRHPQRGRPDARLHAGQLRRLEPPQEKRGGKQRRRVRQCRRHVPDRLEHQMGARRVPAGMAARNCPMLLAPGPRPSRS